MHFSLNHGTRLTSEPGDLWEVWGGCDTESGVSEMSCHCTSDTELTNTLISWALPLNQTVLRLQRTPLYADCCTSTYLNANHDGWLSTGTCARVIKPHCACPHARWCPDVLCECWPRPRAPCLGDNDNKIVNRNSEWPVQSPGQS